MKLVYLLIILALSSSLIETQGGDVVNLSINLADNERHIYNFGDLSRFGISNIEWPDNLPNNQRIIPYSDHPSQTVSQSITSLASIVLSDTQKNMIGYYFLQKSKNTFDVYIMFYSSIIDPNSGILERKELSTLVLLPDIDLLFFQIFASFVDASSGFVSYQVNEQENYGVVRFQYQDGVGLTLDKTVMNNYIQNHVAVVGQSQQIYILTYVKAQVSLYKYTSNSVLNLKHRIVLGQEQLVNIFVDTLNLLMWYSKQNELIYTASVNLQKEQIVISSGNSNLINSYYQGQSLQRIQDSLVFVLSNNDSSLVIQLQMQENVMIDFIDIVRIDQISFSLTSRTYLINSNIISFIRDSNLFLVNIKSNQIIFSQTLDSPYYSFDPSECIASSIILSTSKTNDQKQTEYFVKAIDLSNPSMIIYGTNQVFNFSLTSQFGIVQKYSLNVNAVSSPVTTFLKSQVYLSNLVSQTNIDNQLFDIERYIIGQNLDFQLLVDTDTVLQDVSIQKLVKRPAQRISFDPQYVVSLHRTDGYFESIYMTTQLDVTAIYSYTDINGIISINVYFSNMTFESQINLIDNYGSFTVQGSRKIYIPFLQETFLSFNFYETSCDNQKTFGFTTDPMNSFLFVKCDGEIQQINYQYSGTDNSSLYIISQNSISSDAQSFTSLIVIQGNLFLSNESQIKSYNTLTKTWSKNILSVKQISATSKQQIILFSSSFLVVVLDNPVTIIQQYSYGSFQTTDPVYLRNFYISSDFKINPANNQFIIRDNIEYFFIATDNSPNYLIYRINTQYSSQNQFYATTNILPSDQSIPIINSQFICQLGKTMRCDEILQSASIEYQVGISEKVFNQGLVFPATITLKSDNDLQTYNVFIQRDGSTQYGTVNQDAPSLQKLRATLQDTNFTSGSSFFFDDLEVFNACIPGWKGLNDAQYQILNRITYALDFESNVIFNILYGLKASRLNGSLTIGNQLLTIDGDFEDCIILDDQSSLIPKFPTSFTINIYGLCPKYLITMNIFFTLDNEGAYQVAKLISNNSQPLSDYKRQYQNYQRIITVGNDLVIFNYSGTNQYQISYNEQKKTLEISDYVPQMFSLISYNVINSLNLHLSFSSIGFLHIINTKTSENSQVFIQDMLAMLNFFVESTDTIQGVLQYSDTSFRIVFLNSFIYDVTFDLGSHHQIIVKNVYQYYYKDVMKNLMIAKSTNTYSLFVGYSQFDITVALYRNKDKQSNQYLIQSSSDITEIRYAYFPSYIEQIDDNKFTVYLSNGAQFSIEISDHVGFKLLQNKSSFGVQNVVMYIEGFDVKNWVKFSFQSPQPSPSTFEPRLLATILLLIALSILI